VRYFTHLFSIVSAMQEIGGLPPQELQALIMEERSRGRYTFDDSWAASRTLGFGQDGHLGLDFEDDIEDEFVANAWRDAVRWAWRDPDNGSALLRDAHEAFRMLAEARGSAKLRQMWESGCAKMLTPERAYDVLEIPKDTDESMLLTVFSLRVRRVLPVLALSLRTGIPYLTLI
jgi:ubiquitin carboxyl-terminal hydrolase 25/28